MENETRLDDYVRELCALWNGLESASRAIEEFNEDVFDMQLETQCELARVLNTLCEE